MFVSGHQNKANAFEQENNTFFGMYSLIWLRTSIWLN